MKKIAVIGAGPSGIMAAINAKTANNSVTLFDKKDRIGKKILVTGNGRCNFTNALMSPDYYYSEDDDFLVRALSKFSNRDLISFFQGLGMLVHERNGYFYPYSDQASTVLDVLRLKLSEKDIWVETDKNIVSVKKTDSGFILSDVDNNEYSFDYVVIATGGKAGIAKNEKANGYNIVKKLGHSVTNLYPALTQIKCEGLNFKGLSGVKSDAHIYLFAGENLLMQQQGELLFNDTGISGIVSFQLSHCVSLCLEENNDVTLVCDLIPGLSKEEVQNFVKVKSLLYSNQTLEEFFTGFHNKKLNVEVIKACGFKPSTKVCDISIDELYDIALRFKEIVITATGVSDFEKAQVTGGGVPTNEISDNFESNIVKGLFLTGEILDVDGLCGGYNLQWAFTSGYIAGEYISKQD